MAGGIQTLFRGMQSFTPLTKINKLTGIDHSRRIFFRNSTHREGHERRETVVSSPALDSNNPEKEIVSRQAHKRFPSEITLTKRECISGQKVIFQNTR